MLNLTQDNYFKREADNDYMSASQYKDFAGTLGIVGCQARAMAKLEGKWSDTPSTAMLVGSYVDAYFSDELDMFMKEHPEIFTQKGTLRAEYKRAEEVIARIERDDYFMIHLSGEKQRIMTATLFDVDWKIKIDSFIPDIAIVDLKVMRNLRDSHYTKDYGYSNFIQYYGYDVQGAIYQKVVELNTGKKLPFRIAAASKEEYPDLEIIQIEQSLLDDALSLVEANISMIVAGKEKTYEPFRCEVCDYCKHTRILTKPIHSSELLGEI